MPHQHMYDNIRFDTNYGILSWLHQELPVCLIFTPMIYLCVSTLIARQICCCLGAGFAVTGFIARTNVEGNVGTPIPCSTAAQSLSIYDSTSISSFVYTRYSSI